MSVIRVRKNKKIKLRKNQKMSKLSKVHLTNLLLTGVYHMNYEGEMPDVVVCENSGPVCINCGNVDKFSIDTVEVEEYESGGLKNNVIAFLGMVCNECCDSHVFIIYDNDKAFDVDGVTVFLNKEDELSLLPEELDEETLVSMLVKELSCDMDLPLDEWFDFDENEPDKTSSFLVATRSDDNIDYAGDYPNGDSDKEEEWKSVCFL